MVKLRDVIVARTDDTGGALTFDPTTLSTPSPKQSLIHPEFQPQLWMGKLSTPLNTCSPTAPSAATNEKGSL